MKPVRMSQHAREQAALRGTNEAEIGEAIAQGSRQAAKHGRWMYRHNFQFGAKWQGNFYPIKQVAPVVIEKKSEFVVVTVYTFYF